MQTTGNLGLKKPDGTDIVDIADLNGNMDVLDTAVKNVQDHTVDTVKHITAAERTAWNAKASTAAATASAAGLMAAADKAKLDGIAAGANKYVHPNHTGDVTSTGDGVTAIAPGVIVNADINAAAAIDATKIGTGVVSNAEFGYLDGVTSGIQGQLNSKAPLATTPQQTTADITYYVRTDGNDGNNGLANTAGGAFRTIAKALNAVPSVVNHTVNIMVGAGTYTESLVIYGFTGRGSLSVAGSISSAASTYIVTGQIASMRNACRVQIIGFKTTFSTGSAIYVTNTNETFIQYCTTDVSTSNFGVYVENAKVYLNGCVVSGKTDAAFYAHVNSEIFVQDCGGSANNVGHKAAYGGRIHIAGTYVGSTLMQISVEGGMVTKGIGVINPWGDNTQDQRVHARVQLSQQYVMVPSVWSKIIFDAKIKDHLGNFQTSSGTYRFVAPAPGIYNINTGVTVLSLPATGSIQLVLRVSGSDFYRLGYKDNESSTARNYYMNGSASLYLGTGDYVEIYFYTTHSVTLSAGADTFIDVTRIA
ncbi:hypothetical protein JI735_05020 [Paenibacillus sonchi]|uniref:C1q domain-containing protein n=1 Tax=Paenibacillus sonchi TaxID=373687 RepID=A0A974PDV4_9BACL|nr:hypothetical protein [Paenibacillus sonchi]QQZ62040.1 hypothetical protein JI735_05020 [Paenibacillus sonchi]